MVLSIYKGVIMISIKKEEFRQHLFALTNYAATANYSQAVFSYCIAHKVISIIKNSSDIHGAETDITYDAYLENTKSFIDRVVSILFLSIALVDKYPEEWITFN